MNSHESIILVGMLLAFSATLLLISIAGWRWALASDVDYRKKRKLLLTMWAPLACSYVLLEMGIDWLTGEKVTVMGLMGGLTGAAWGFVLLFVGQRIAARSLGFQLLRR